MNFQRRLFLAFVAPVALLVVGLLGAIVALNRTEASFDHFVHTEQAIDNSLQELHASALQRGQLLRNLILDSGNPETLKSFEQASQAYEDAFRRALGLSSQSATHEKVRALAPLVKGYAEAQQKVMDTASSSIPMAILAINANETPAWQSLHVALKAISQNSLVASQESYQQASSASIRAQWVASGLALVAVALSAGLGWMVRQTLRRDIGGDPRDAKVTFKRIAEGDLSGEIPPAQARESLMAALETMQSTLRTLVSKIHTATDNIQVASNEIAMGNQDLSLRTEQTASSLQETAASMEQLTSTVRNSADAARQANQLASSAAQIASRGGEVVSQVVSTMDEINHSSKKINDIIGVIDGIAFQTNILALNAAVEAARAGEQGRGFAVVAGEVRNLAQRSAQAAKEIKGLIGASVERVEVGSRLVADAGQTMSEIVGSVQRVSDIIGEITAAAGEQSEGIAQVNTAVSQLDQMTQQNAALVEQSAAAAQSLKEQAARLAETVQVFRVTSTHNPTVPSPLAATSLVVVAAPNEPPTLPKPSARSMPIAVTAVNRTHSSEGDWETF